MYIFVSYLTKHLTSNTQIFHINTHSHNGSTNYTNTHARTNQIYTHARAQITHTRE